ncbi:MAG: alpha/beta fold hydrolase [Pseudomonadota bacterium]
MILLHGIWMPGPEMSLLGRRLARQGFSVATFRYRSVRRSPAENAQHLAEVVRGFGDRTVHLVGHSLGGIVILHLIQLYPQLPIGRMVLIGSPVNGSFAARRLNALPGGRWLLGRSTRAGLLGGAPNALRGHEIGTLSGVGGIGLGRVLGRLPTPNDGTVAVAETRLAGAADARTVRGSHLGLIAIREVAKLTGRFLRSGRFGPAPGQ